MQDVMQILCENRDLCYITTYYFVYQNERVNDFAELSSLPDLGEGSEFHIAQGMIGLLCMKRGTFLAHVMLL